MTLSLRPRELPSNRRPIFSSKKFCFQLVKNRERVNERVKIEMRGERTVRGERERAKGKRANTERGRGERERVMREERRR